MRPNAIASALLRLASSWPEDQIKRKVVRLARLIRQGLVRLGWDPPCRVHLSGCHWELLVPLSHELPTYWNRFPTYDRLPQVIAEIVRAAKGDLFMIDVGANVGDTVRLTAPRENDQYLAIEPHPEFFNYLKANLRSFPCVKYARVACGSASAQGFISSGHRGTAGRSINEDRISVPVVSLDQLLEDVWTSQRIDFIKIDTDGFDLDVLAGAWGAITRERPIILLECDLRLSGRGKKEWLDVVGRIFECGYFCVDVFDNFGLNVGRITQERLSLLSDALESQGKVVHYHDLLFLPTNALAQELSALRSQSGATLKY